MYAMFFHLLNQTAVPKKPFSLLFYYFNYTKTLQSFFSVCFSTRKWVPWGKGSCLIKTWAPLNLHVLCPKCEFCFLLSSGVWTIFISSLVNAFYVSSFTYIFHYFIGPVYIENLRIFQKQFIFSKITDKSLNYLKTLKSYLDFKPFTKIKYLFPYGK